MAVDFRDSAIREVIARHGEDGAIDTTILEDCENFHRGHLIRVGFTGKNKTDYEDWVYFDDTGIHICPNDRELIALIKRTSIDDPVYLRILKIAGIPGAIAIAITLTICFLAIKRLEIDGVLANALTAILGFYFAVSVYESKPKK